MKNYSFPDATKIWSAEEKNPTEFFPIVTKLLMKKSQMVLKMNLKNELIRCVHFQKWQQKLDR